jgi:hypothetical protein
MFDGTTLPAMREPKLSRREPLSADDFSPLKGMTRRPIKADLPTPSVPHLFTGDVVFDRGIYPVRGR